MASHRQWVEKPVVQARKVWIATLACGHVVEVAPRERRPKAAQCRLCGPKRPGPRPVYGIPIFGGRARRWPTAAHAERALSEHGTTTGSVSRALRGVTHTAYGYTWLWAEEYEKRSRQGKKVTKSRRS